jgi:hypothetical protein
MPAMATASVSSFFICAVAAVLVAIFLRHNFAAVSTGVVEDPTWTSEPLRGPTSTVSCWLGFAFNSTLGYPGEGPPTCSEFDEGTELWLQELEMTKRLIEELPVVRDVTFYYHEDDPNLNYIQATLWCCWSGGRLKRLKEATDQTGKKPTHLEAAKALHDTVVKKHACEGHPYHPRAVARRQELAANETTADADEEAEPEVATAFDRIRLAQARQQSAARQASAAEQAAEMAREAEVAARLAREEAELQGAARGRGCPTAKGAFA